MKFKAKENNCSNYPKIPLPNHFYFPISSNTEISTVFQINIIKYQLSK